jgi:hypothetical protein
VNQAMISLLNRLLLPSAIAAVFVAIVVFYGYEIVVRYCDGNFVYILDDAYIHLSIAQNLMVRGIYAVNADFPALASSSPVWPFLLATTSAISNDITHSPLIINAVVSAIVLVIITVICQKGGLSWISTIVVSGVVWVTVPMAVMIFNGMEHALHIASVFLLLLAYMQWELSEDFGKRIPPLMIVSIILALLVRYETIGLVFGIGCTLAFRKHWKVVAQLLLIVLAVLVTMTLLLWLAYGVAVPYSVAVKVFTGKGEVYVYLRGLKNLLMLRSFWPDIHYRLILLLFALLTVQSMLRYERIASPTGSFALVLVIAILAHSMFHVDVSMYRYSGYLVAPVVVVVLLDLHSILQKSRLNKVLLRASSAFPALLVVLAMIASVFDAGQKATRLIPNAAKNISEQQILTARFVDTFYRDEAVAVNDIGAVAYYSRSKIIDLVGLAYPDAAKSKIRGEYGSLYLEDLVLRESVSVIIICDAWFTGRNAPPASWIKVSEWTISDNIICSDSTIALYAPDIVNAHRLYDNINTFAEMGDLSKNISMKHYVDLLK